MCRCVPHKGAGWPFAHGIDQSRYARGLPFRFEFHAPVGAIAHVPDEAKVPRHAAQKKTKTHPLNNTVYPDMDSPQGTHSSFADATASHRI